MPESDEQHPAESDMAARKLRILCLHGYTQSGPLFRSKTRALEKRLQKSLPAAPKPGYLSPYPGGIEFHYLTGPHKLQRADIPSFDSNISHTDSTFGNGSQDTNGDDAASEEDEAFGWWVKSTSQPSTSSTGPDWTFATASASSSQSAHSNTQSKESIVYTGLPETLDYLATTLQKDGPFDGVLGFSQGACLAIILAALLEPGRAKHFPPANAADASDGHPLRYPTLLQDQKTGDIPHPPLKFAISYSGFRAPGGQGYDGFYTGGLSTPTLHFIGSVDTVVEESRSLASVQACRGSAKGLEAESKHRVVYHPGGHFVPAGQKNVVAAVESFVREFAEGGITKSAETAEEGVEDMDMPF